MIAAPNGRTRVLAVSSFLNTTPAIENVAAHIDRDRFEYAGVFLNNQDPHLRTHLAGLGWRAEWVPYRGKRDAMPAALRIARAIRALRPHVVHTYMVDATYLGLVAARLTGVPRRMHTRYHSDLHHVEFPHALKYDRLANWLSTAIVAPGQVARTILLEQEGVPARKVHVINDPLHLERFVRPPASDVAAVRQQYNPEGRAPVIGVVSRWVEWKGVQFTIPAVAKLLDQYPDLLLVLANAHGPHEPVIRNLLDQHLPRRNWTTVQFEPRNHALFKLFDVFVHVPVGPYRENTGGVYCEAFAAGVPSVITLSGIAPEFAVHEQNCWVVPFQDSGAITHGIRAILERAELAREFRTRAPAAVLDRFSIAGHLALLEQLYEAGRIPVGLGEPDSPIRAGR